MTTQAALVRPVRADDRDALVDLLRLRHEEFGLGRYSPSRASDMIHAAIEAKQPVIVGVIDGDCALVATIGLSLAQAWDEDEPHLAAMWDYVHPDHRTAAVGAPTGYVPRLHQFAMLAADRLGMPLIMGAAMRADSQGKIHAYCKNFRPAGAFFTYGGDGWKRPSKVRREDAAGSLIRLFGGGAT